MVAYYYTVASFYFGFGTRNYLKKAKLVPEAGFEPTLSLDVA